MFSSINHRRRNIPAFGWGGGIITVNVRYLGSPYKHHRPSTTKIFFFENRLEMHAVYPWFLKKKCLKMDVLLWEHRGNENGDVKSTRTITEPRNIDRHENALNT